MRRHSLIRRCSSLAFLFIQFSLRFHEACGSDIVAATQPLHREIESLKEQLETLEAKHDTLEAATEQFRRKTKAMKDKLDVERGRYDSLMMQMESVEKRHKDETDVLSAALEKAETARASAENWLESSLTNARDAQLRHEKELKDKITQVEYYMDLADQASTENQQLKLLLKQRDEELSEAKSTYLQLQQKLFAVNEQLSELEQQAQLTIWSAYWQRIKDAEATEVAVRLVQEFTEQLRNESLPRWSELVARHYDAIQQNTKAGVEDLSAKFKSCRDAAMRQQAKFVDSVNHALDVLRGIDLSGIDVWESLSTLFSTMYRDIVTMSVPVLTQYSDRVGTMFLPKLVDLHERATEYLRGGVLVASTYYIESFGGTQGDTFTSACTFAENHSDAITLVLEVLFGLMVVDFALSSILELYSAWGNTKRAGYRGRTSLSMNGAPPSASLLRTAGSLSRRDK